MKVQKFYFLPAKKKIVECREELGPFSNRTGLSRRAVASGCDSPCKKKQRLYVDEELQGMEGKLVAGSSTFAAFFT